MPTLPIGSTGPRRQRRRQRRDDAPEDATLEFEGRQDGLGRERPTDEFDRGHPPDERAADEQRTQPAADLGTPSVVLHVRSSSACHDHEAAVLAELEGLAADGVIAGLTVRVWPEKVSLRPMTEERAAFAETFREFEQWATEHERSIRPPFVVRHQNSAITQERDDVLVTPMLFLSVYDDGELAGLYPCHDGEQVTDIDAWLARLGDGATPDAADSRDGDGRLARRQSGETR